MSLQEVFYLIGIIFMVILATVIITIGVIFFLIYRQIRSIQNHLVLKINDLTRPAEIALNLGAAVAEKAAKGVKSLIKPKPKEVK